MNNQSSKTQTSPVEELLSKVSFKIEDEILSTTYEQALRRALLNCRLWERNYFKKYFDYFKQILPNYFIFEAVIVSGFVVMAISGVFLNRAFLIPAPENLNTENQFNLVQTLEKEGKIKFSHAGSDGTRVYTMELVNSSGTIELLNSNANIRLISK